jgi:hypothetical protein
VEGGADYAIVDGAVSSTGEQLGEQSQLVSTAVARWRHDWGRYVTSTLDAGAVHVYKITHNAELWHPAGLALLSYARREGDASLSYRHTVRTDLFLGNTFLMDEVSLRGSIPLEKRGRVVIAASVGYQHNRLIDIDGDLATEVDVWLGDAGVLWRARDHLGLALRYQHINQTSGALLPPLPLTFVKNTIMATATLHFPPETRMPRTYRPPQRVDEDDSLRNDDDEPQRQSR